ncbi:hypothetical protein V1264_020066 [Littorina saxatilis]|uniref:Uncharacterized protein n=1 Tax=Littorina saxatilis TaxID=31220 RepID=A0AAN9BAS7_9CAEN
MAEQQNQPPLQAERRHYTANVPVPSKLGMEGNLSQNWKKFRRQWDNYEIASRLDKEREYRCAVLLACIGEDAVDVYDSMRFTEGENKKDISVVIKKLKDFCVGATHEAFETYKFHTRSQEASESIEAYVAALRKLVKNCNYGEMEDRMLRDRIVVGVKSDAAREKLLEDSTLNFKKAVYETSQQQLREMSKDVSVDRFTSTNKSGSRPTGSQQTPKVQILPIHPKRYQSQTVSLLSLWENPTSQQRSMPSQERQVPQMLQSGSLCDGLPFFQHPNSGRGRRSRSLFGFSGG